MAGTHNSIRRDANATYKLNNVNKKKTFPRGVVENDPSQRRRVIYHTELSTYM